ncbi:MAG: hypothetical protein ACTS6O_01320 [Giesbergeria sp.]
MIKSWQVAPGLAIVALAASAWWWQTGKDAWRAPVARKPELPAVADILSPAVFHAQQALARPVLWASRRPISAAEPKGGVAQELVESRLTAVFASGSQQLAILQRKDGSTLKLGADSAPWRLESFDGRKAVFVSGDKQRIERLLERGPTVSDTRLLPGVPAKPPAGQ